MIFALIHHHTRVLVKKRCKGTPFRLNLQLFGEKSRKCKSKFACMMDYAYICMFNSKETRIIINDN